MRIARLLVTLTLTFGMTLALGGVASADAPHPPQGGLGDAPLNSGQARTNAGDNYGAAITASDGAAANSLVRNPACADYDPSLHP